MSMHEVEDIIEATVHLIDAANKSDVQKREDLFNLYQLEYFYDTSYTHFRVMDILLKYRYVYKMPLNTHPDYTVKIPVLNTGIDGGWIESLNKEYTVYAQREGEDIFLYGNAGSAIWQIWADKKVLGDDEKIAPQKNTVPNTILLFMQMAVDAGNKKLMEEWYALFVNGVLNRTFGEMQGVPKNFIQLTNTSTLISIRELAQEHALGKKRRKEDDEDLLMLPTIKSEKKIVNTPDEEYSVLFFLDFKKAVSALLSGYKKASVPLDNPERKINRIKQVLDDTLQGWVFVNEIHTETQKIWIWFHDRITSSGTHRLFLQVQYDAELKMIYPELAMQHELLLQWQQRQPDSKISHSHFNYSLVGILPAEMTKGSKFINPYGGWIYNLKKTEAVLQKVLNDFTDKTLKATDLYLEFITTEFPDIYFTRNADELIESFDGFGIPNYVLVDSRYYIPLLFYFYYQDKGDFSLAKKYMKQAQELGKQCSKVQKDELLQPFFDSYNAGKNPPLPLVFHKYLLSEIKEDDR